MAESKKCSSFIPRKISGQINPGSNSLYPNRKMLIIDKKFIVFSGDLVNG